jgi:solute carrier family 35 protein F1/2
MNNIDISVLLLVGFALCLYILYSILPVVIAKTSATAVNLNLLSADFYALFVGLFVFHYSVGK